MQISVHIVADSITEAARYNAIISNTNISVTGYPNAGPISNDLHIPIVADDVEVRLSREFFQNLSEEILGDNVQILSLFLGAIAQLQPSIDDIRAKEAEATD